MPTGGERSVQSDLPAHPSGAAPRLPWTTRTYLAWIIGITLVALLAGSAYAFLWSTGHARSEALASMDVRADRAAQRMVSGVDAVRETVRDVAHQQGVDAGFDTPDGCRLTATGSVTFPSVRLDMVTPGGDVLCSSDPDVTGARGVHAHSDWLEAALTAGPHTVWDDTDAVTGRPSAIVSVGVQREGRTVGAVVGFLLLPEVARTFRSDLEGIRATVFTVVDVKDGRVLSSSRVSPGDDTHVRVAGRRGEVKGLDGTTRIVASSHVGTSGLRVYAGVDRADVVAQARGSLERYLLVGLLAALALIAGVVLLDHRLARPLRSLTRAVTRAGQGADAVRVEERGTAEVVALAREFNAMMDARAGHEAQLVHHASHDPLTGLPNRFLLAQIVDELLGGEQRQVSLLMLGIDRFRLINDGLGHEAADAILCEVARRLGESLRSGDTLARFGGDEFMLLLPGTGEAAATEVAQRLHDSLAEPFTASGDDVRVRASIGLSVVWAGSVTSEQAVRQAVAAMRHAKSVHQDTCVYDETLQVRATYQLDVERDLRRALELGELTVHYQPLIDLSSGTVVGAEALVRWQHPDRGVVPPLEFIPVAEQSGQIVDIGSFVLAQACRDAAAWAAAGNSLRVSVNVAVTQLHGREFPAEVADVLARTGLPSHLLCLEITESSLMRSDQNRSDGLAALRQLGVHLAIDDFGTGYSSLAYLHSLPVDELKIDRSFVNRLGADARDRHLVQAIIGMASALGLTVVAEGVETEEQLGYLAEHGCHLAQGYLFSMPLPGEDFRVGFAASGTDGTGVSVCRS